MARAAALLGIVFCCQLLLAQGQPAVANSDLEKAAAKTMASESHPNMNSLPGSPTAAKAATPHQSWGAFWAITAATTALTVTDIELSQSCLQQGTCREMNPLRPRSRASAYAIQMPLTAMGAWLSYRLKKHHRKCWWSPQIGIVAGHAIGTASGVRAAQ
ncbi:MAG TPA: hypothetical protein VLC12_05050 [Terriglobales bacterium]|nr:hypothetical protein [Terriglobales bacterium]